MLCTKAPSWDGEIRLPGPLHLAMQVAKDHPAIAMQRRAYA
ncbi:RNaseH domain-containing protein [Massilia atriviolacea]